MSEEKKLHVDEDWKSQVDREKELLRSKQTQPGPSQTSASPNEEKVATVNDNVAEQTKSASEMDRLPHEADDLPPASMILLISSLASQAMAAMGQLPGEDGKPLPVSLPFARHFIDLIGVIEDKTRNNLTEEETSMLKSTLHHLRLMFVECSRRK